MNAILAVFGNTLQDSNSLLMGLLVFLATGTLAFCLMAFVRVRGAVKRRTSRIAVDDSKRNPKRSLRYSSLKAVANLIDYTTKHYSGTDDETMKVLRQRLVQAGIYDPRGVAFFFIGRTALAVGLAAFVFFVLPMMRPTSGGTMFWLMVVAGGLAG